MPIESINSIAQQSYSQIQDRPKISANDSFERAASFQDVMSRQLNSFAKMSPRQILSLIQNAKSSESMFLNANNGSLLASATNAVRSAVAKQENVARKSLIGEASLVELVTAVNDAKNIMQTTTKIRDELMKAFEGVMNMTM